jgi:hypothetical protein
VSEDQVGFKQEIHPAAFVVDTFDVGVCLGTPVGCIASWQALRKLVYHFDVGGEVLRLCMNRTSIMLPHRLRR